MEGNEVEYVCLEESEYDQMCMDLSFWAATTELLNEILEKNGIEVMIPEDDIWKKVREMESASDELC